MEAVKKLEVITNSLELPLLAILDKVGVSGYTIINDVTGRGDRGIINDLETSVVSNGYVMSICTAEQELQLVEAITPILKKFVTVCIVSDAKWIVH